MAIAERKRDSEPERRADHGELSPKRWDWVAWVLPGAGALLRGEAPAMLSPPSASVQSSKSKSKF